MFDRHSKLTPRALLLYESKCVFRHLPFQILRASLLLYVTHMKVFFNRATPYSILKKFIAKARYC
jgi:hypothetical protein